MTNCNTIYEFSLQQLLANLEKIAHELFDTKFKDYGNGPSDSHRTDNARDAFRHSFTAACLSLSFNPHILSESVEAYIRIRGWKGEGVRSLEDIKT